MRSFGWSVFAFLSVLVLGDPVVAQTVSAEPRWPGKSSPFMRVFGHSDAPYGFIRFCEADPLECRPSGVQDIRIEASAKRLAELDEINRRINREIEPATDLEIYGVQELWTIPKTRGDCEDYALLKRQILIKRGWPSSALLMTVVRDEKGEGHAVLMARTSAGDFVLDNKTDEMKLWNRTPYEFVMRQSYIDPRIWVSLDPRDAGPPDEFAGLKRRR